MSLDVTQRESALCNAQSLGVPSERETGLSGPESLHSAMTDSDRRPFDTAAWVEKFRGHFTPPELLAERRPALDTMRRYALRGRYTEDTAGWRRALGIAWYRGVAAPGLVLSRIWEWVTERPARFLVIAVTVKFLSFLPPVAWLVDHVIHPGSDLLLRVFL